MFAVPDGYVMAVMFGGVSPSATVALRLPEVSGGEGAERAVEVWHPGSGQPIAAKLVRRGDGWQIDVPLQRGCAMVKIMAVAPVAAKPGR